MDAQRITDLLAGTAHGDAKVREPAEKTLEQIHKIIGFTPKLLEIARDNTVNFPIRQAASIYLKNNVSKYWENSNSQAIDLTVFVIHDHDKTLIRDSILDAIVQCQHDLLTVHLVACCNFIIKSDFPHKWPSVVDKIHFLLQQNDFYSWNAALLVFHQLSKIYEYRNSHERRPFLEALRILLPATSQRMSQLLQTDPLGEQSCKLQKQILKTFHAILQYSLPVTVLTQEVFNQWMAYIVDIAKRDVPDAAQKSVCNDDRPDLIWWKCKKWSFHLLSRIFERYGSPNNVAKEYKQFSEWFIKTFSYPIIQTILKTLEQYAIGQYVSPRVMQQALMYLNTAVLHSMTWKMLKDDMMVVVEKIIFPLMSYTDEDEELWHSDPREYIRMKFDIFEEYVSPVSASQTLLYNLCKKRRNMLQKTMNFVIGVLNNPQTNPKPKDGALHMIGSIASVLMKKPLYKDQLEQLITNYVLPLFACPQGFLRARACWMLSYFVSIEFKNPATIVAATQAVFQCILGDPDLPVKVEAAICLQALLSFQDQQCLDKVRELTKPNVKPLTMELVKIIRVTGNEDVLEVMQKLVYLFHEDVSEVATELTNQLAQTFYELIDQQDLEEDERMSTAMAVISTIDTVLTMMDEKKEIIARLEPIVVNIVLTIFNKSIMDLYEEATTLLSTLTADGISQESWKVFSTLYMVFKRDGCDYFTDMMSPIHNYITVDPQTFLASRDNLAAVYEMCHQILTDPLSGEEIESYAAKLLEVIILQFRNQIDDCIPSFFELAVTRLKREITTTELRTLLLQIVIAIFYSNYELLFSCFEKLQQQENLPPFTLLDTFVKQWFKDIKDGMFLGLHDRKMCIVGMCTLIILPQEKRPPIVNEVASQVVPNVLSLYEKLKIAYEKKANTDDNDSDSDDDDVEDDSDQEAEVLEDDQDHVVNATDEGNEDDGDFEDIADDDDTDDDDEDYEGDEDDDCEQTALESFETILDTEKGLVDEFVLFRDTMERIRLENVNWYQTLLGSLDAGQQKKLIELGQFTEKRVRERWIQAGDAQQQLQQLQQQQQLQGG